MSMYEWMEETWRVLRFLLGNPGSPLELVCLVVVVLVAAGIGLGRIGAMLGARNTGAVSAFLVAVCGLALAVAGATAVRVVVVPRVDPYLYSARWPLVLGAGLTFLVLVAPLTGLLLRANVQTSLMLWALTLVVACVMGALTHAVFQAVDAGGEVSDRTIERKRNTERFLGE